ncbi:MAG: cyclic nucleotide-binding domain-containing protein [Rhizobiaceae bacterium]
MSLESDIRVLGNVELFRNLNNDQLRLLAFGAESVRLKAGRDLYRENAPADCAFIIVDGRVALWQVLNGRRETVASVGEGALLGELALITSGNRLTGAVAETDCELLRLNRKLFRRMLEEYPDTAARLHERITENLRDMLEQIGRLGSAFEER